jgi:DinB superfamily
MAIVADTKDWTWVLERPCPDCGFDTRSIDGRDASRIVRQQGDLWGRMVLEGGDVRIRPSPDRWSVLEYACHVRDVFRLGDLRIGLMVTQVHPALINWDQDATALADAYETQDPAAVAIELRAAASVLSDALDALGDADWSRPGTRSDGAVFTVDSFARYVVHDVVHHVYDVAPPA